ncbi:MAG: hypothetical protein P8R35_01770 [Planctomycetota bacterium]|nr:hypothetical protein [Planctomycetota bacterium]
MSIATPFLYLLASFVAQDTTSSTSTEAEALMREVAAAQFSDANATPMTRFEVQLFLRERGEHPREFGFLLNYASHPQETFELAIDDVESNTQIRKGFDGKEYWLRQAGEEKQILSGREFTEDRQAIEDGLTLSSDLMVLLDLGQFADNNPPTKLTTSDTGTRILEGTITRQQQLYTYRIHLDAEQVLPSMVDFILYDDEQQQVQFQRFSTLAYKAYAGRQIPQVLCEFDSDDSKALPQRIYEIHHLSWGPHPSPPSDDKKPSQGQRN